MSFKTSHRRYCKSVIVCLVFDLCLADLKPGLSIEAAVQRKRSCGFQSRTLVR
jgi:hypothetical protein